jgi:hypothetical protein
MVALGSALVAGCRPGYEVNYATAAEQRALTVRRVDGGQPTALQRAAAIALKLQGFEVVVTEPMIRTAPKVVGTYSSAFAGTYSAFSNSDVETLAWDVSISTLEGGCLVSMTPRHARGDGTQYTEWDKAYLERLTNTLFRLIVESVPIDASSTVPPAL